MPNGAAGSGKGKSFRVEVLKVLDGDTIVVRRTGRKSELRIRLHGIDAPELSQPYGREATEHLKNIALYQRLTLEVIGPSDHYDRTVGVLYESRRDNSINRQMVRAGLAFNYDHYGTLEGVGQAEATARERKVGVWVMPNGGTRPWDYRLERRIAARERWQQVSRTPITGRTSGEVQRRGASGNDDWGCIVVPLALVGLFIVLAILGRCT